MILREDSGPERYVDAIRTKRLSIYDRIEVGDPELWIPTPQLEWLLNKGMAGISLTGLPLRTRSKVVKKQICRYLGYRVPSSFKKTQPRFLGQLFDVYVQKSNNLQVWNEELKPMRRYVIICVGSSDRITKVKVVTGKTLAQLDSTGTLTQKYQARLIYQKEKVELFTDQDTERLHPFVSADVELPVGASPVNPLKRGQILSIRAVFEQLKLLVGESFADIGYDQERNRGALLHQLVCQHLGYSHYRDNGQFPDVSHQLLEVKLQTSRTIDLGMVKPDSEDMLDGQKIEGKQIRYCDVRYAVFYADTDGKSVTITHLYMSTGLSFFTRFMLSQGKVLNRKLQIPLPPHFFDEI